MRKDLEQGSAAWLQWRLEGIGASDAPVIMGVSPYKTPLDLYREKKGIYQQPQTAAMARGNHLEPYIREQFIEMVGVEVHPGCFEHSELEWCRCSVDGINIQRQMVIEIKAPKKSDHERALNKKVPDHYYPQVQHILFVTGLQFLFYVSYYADDLAIVEVERDDDYIETLVEQEKKFLENVKKGVPPSPTSEDYDIIDDPEEVKLASTYERILVEISELENKKEEIRKYFVQKASERSLKCGSLKVCRYESQGSIDYKSIPELEGVDLEKYRKESSIRHRITIH